MLYLLTEKLAVFVNVCLYNIKGASYPYSEYYFCEFRDSGAVALLTSDASEKGKFSSVKYFLLYEKTLYV